MEQYNWFMNEWKSNFTVPGKTPRLLKEEIMAEFKPNYAVPPGRTLEDILWFRELSISELAEKTGFSQKVLADVVSDKTPIDPGMAIQFEKALGVFASFWLNLEENYQKDKKRLVMST